MKTLSIITIFFFYHLSFGQERTITGSVLDEDLQPFPGILISCDSIVIASTDMDGNFKFNLPADIRQIEFNYVGMQKQIVYISNDCNHYGIVMLYDYTYCFMSPEKAKRKEKRHRKKLPKLHAEANERDLFGKEKSCQ